MRYYRWSNELLSRLLRSNRPVDSFCPHLLMGVHVHCVCVKIALSATGRQNGHISPWLRLAINPCIDGCTHEPDTVFVNESCLFVLVFRGFFYSFAISRPHICLFVSSSFSAKLQAHRKTGVRLKVWLIHNPPQSPRPRWLASLGGPVLPAAMVNKSLPDPSKTTGPSSYSGRQRHE